MTLNDFIKKWDGKGIDFDGVYGNQCMDLMHQYVVECLGLTDGRILAAPTAKAVYQGYPNTFGSDNFDKIDNTIDGFPQVGDIIFWKEPMGKYIDDSGKTQYAGHVAIVKTADINKFTSFDQNYGHAYCELIAHPDYTAVLGWLRPKNIPTTQTTIPVDKNDFAKLVNKSSERDAIRVYLGLPLDPLDDKGTKVIESIKGKENLATGLQRQLGEAQILTQNEKDRADRIKQTYEASANTDKTRIEALQAAEIAWQTEKGSLLGQLEEHSKAEGNAKIEAQQWKTKYDQAMASVTTPLTFGDVLVLLFKKAFTIKLK